MKSRKALTIAFAGLLLAAGLPVTAQDAAPPPDQQSAPLLSPQQLDNLVAPIALYPDSLLSQVLVASTYPLEVTEAAQWLQQNSGLQGQQLTDAARGQNWDASIQALVAFPDVLNRMNSDIRWTTDLGNAFLAQQPDVMNAVQRMRARARDAGRLNSTPQQNVTTETQDGRTVIEIVPANPEVVYVPSYNPEYIWGPPVWGYYPPLWYPSISWGFGFWPGIHIGFFWGGLGWGGWGWGPNWFGCSVYERPFFFSHYGYHGFVGYGYGRFGGGYGVWAHNPEHRLGVAYPNRAVAGRFGGYSRGGAAFAGNRPVGQHGFTGANNFGSRGNAGVNAHVNSPAARGAQTGNWSRFSQARPNEARPGTAQSLQRMAPTSPRSTPPANTARGFSSTVPSYHSTPSYNSRGYSGTVPSRSTPSYSGSRSFSGTVPSYNSTPSYNNRGFSGSAPSYHSTPSYGSGRNYSAPAPSRNYSAPAPSRSYSAPAPSYHYSAPSYRSAPSMGSYGRSTPSYRAPSGGGSGVSSAPRSYSSGGGHSGGGSGAFHGGGGGGGGHVSGGGGGHHR